MPSCAQAAPSSEDAAKTETSFEFPQWAKDIRRADVISFGVFPFAWFVTSIIIDLDRASKQNWNADYRPWPAASQTPVPWTNDEYFRAIAAASCIAVAVAITDHIIIKIKRKKKREQEFKPDPPIIRRIQYGSSGEQEISPDSNAEYKITPPENGQVKGGG